MSVFCKICAVAVIAGGMGVSALTLAEAQEKQGTETKTTETSTPSNDTSEFEQTRQHMIEMNKESQRTGKM